MAKGSLVAGARIKVRDAEWVVGHVERGTSSGAIVHAVGLSGIVRDKNAIFVETIENTRGRGIKVVDPAEVSLVPDNSSGFVDTLLHLEAALRKSAPTGDAPEVAGKAAIDDLDFQMEPVRLALKAPRVRILIGDDVGLGKTLEAGLLASELILRRRARRILVVSSKSMLTQFQQEFWTRFSIPLVKIDSAKIKQIRARIPLDQNPFNQFEKSIISMDTLKNDTQYRAFLEKAWWDLIVIDEAHNVAERGGPRGGSQRNALAERLASRSDALVLLSATPHDGSRRSFASLMRMLDSTSIADPEHYGPDDIKGLFLRRFRTTPAVKAALKSKVQARVTERLNFEPSEVEERLYDKLACLDLKEDRGARKGQRLFKTLLEKALFSSPAAFQQTLGNRIKHLRLLDDVDSQADLQALSAFLPDLEAMEDCSFAKYQRLLKLLSDIKWKGRDKTDRLVIFSERIATLEWLGRKLREHLGTSDEQIRILHASGQGADIKTQEIIEEFGIERSPIRILLASDMASEGINLHYLSHKLIHFDNPWALLKFQQRNGRIDRYGQERTPFVWYFVGHPKQEKIRGDLRILDRLIERDIAAQENIRDPSVFMGTNDEEAQEDIVADAMERGVTAEQFDAEMEARAKDVETTDDEDHYAALEAFFEVAQPETVPAPADEGTRRPSVFADTFAFTVAALRRVKEWKKELDFRIEETDRVVNLRIPDDFRERTAFGAGSTNAIQPKFMPPEAEPVEGRVKLTDNRVIMNQRIRASRQGTGRGWPEFQYLWDVHPVVDWLSDKVSGVFGRGSAPVARLSGRMASDEVAFVFNGVVPNLKGHPLVDEWPVVVFSAGEFARVETAAEFLARTGLGTTELPNVGEARTDDVARLIEDAVGRAQNHVHYARKSFQARMDEELLRLDEKREALRVKHQRRIADLFDALEDRTTTRNRREREEQRVEDEFRQWWDWIEKTRQTQDDPNPYVRLVAVFRG
jgi:superfamily II DNA or RNA helicase